MINPIMKNHSSLYENNRQTNKSVITHQNTDMTVYCKHKHLTYSLIRDKLISLQNDLMAYECGRILRSDVNSYKSKMFQK